MHSDLTVASACGHHSIAFITQHRCLLQGLECCCPCIHVQQLTVRACTSTCFPLSILWCVTNKPCHSER